MDKKLPALLIVMVMALALTSPIKSDAETDGRELGPAYDSVTATNIDEQHIVENSNHFTYAILSRAELETGADLEMVTGNGLEPVGGARAKLVNGEIKITIDGEGSYGAIAFNQVPKFKNGVIHSQKKAELVNLGAIEGFSHDNNPVIYCPAGDTIYLYIHCDTMSFYQEAAVPPVEEPPGESDEDKSGIVLLTIVYKFQPAVGIEDHLKYTEATKFGIIDKEVPYGDGITDVEAVEAEIRAKTMVFPGYHFHQYEPNINKSPIIITNDTYSVTIYYDKEPNN